MKHRFNPLIAFCIFLLVLPAQVRCNEGVACKRQKSKHHVPNQRAVIKVYDGLRIAVGILKKIKAGDTEYKLIIRRDNQTHCWTYDFIFLPMAFGDEIIVTVEDNGKTRYGSAI